MKKFTAGLVSLLIGVALLLGGCADKTPKTLEEVVASNEQIAAEISQGTDDSGIQIDIKGNTVTYSYDISSVDGVTEEMLEKEDFLKSFQTSLDAQASTFANVCSTLEEKTGIEGISVNVIYTYGDKEIANATYTSADAASTETANSEKTEEAGAEENKAE